MAFSWKQAILNADNNLMRQAKIQAKKGTNETKLKHPDEVRDANQGNYTKLTIRIKNELETKRRIVNERRKLLGNQQT